MLIRDLLKEHPKVELSSSMKACLQSRLPIKLIQPIPNTDKKRVRQMNIDTYVGLDTPIVEVLSDQEVS